MSPLAAEKATSTERIVQASERQTKRAAPAWDDPLQIQTARSELADADRGRAAIAEAELGGCGGREIDNAAAVEWPAIVDGDFDFLAGPLVCDRHLGAERQRAMCRRHERCVHPFAGCGLGAQSVPGCVTASRRSTGLRPTKNCKGSSGGRGESRASNCCQIGRPRSFCPCTLRAKRLSGAKSGQKVGLMITEYYRL